MGLIGAFHDNLGLAPAGFDATHLDMSLIADILGQALVLSLCSTASNGGMSPPTSNLRLFVSTAVTSNRSTRLQSSHRIEHNGKRLIIYIDGSRTVFSGSLCLCKYDSNGMTTPANFLQS